MRQTFLMFGSPVNRFGRRLTVTAALAAICLFACPALAQSAMERPPERFNSPVKLTPGDGTESVVSVRGRDGKPRQLRTALHNWIIPNFQRVDLPQTGLIVCQLRGGTLFTVRGDFAFKGAARLLAPVLGWYVRRQMRRLQLLPVKAEAEARRFSQ